METYSIGEYKDTRYTKSKLKETDEILKWYSKSILILLRRRKI